MFRCIRVSQFGPAGVLQLVNCERSSLKPGHGQILIEARAAGVNPVDTYIRSGNYASLPQLPFTPGSDCAGTVLQVGPGVTDFKPNDRVFTVKTISGAYSQLVLADADTVFPLPDNLDFAEGASLGVPAFTAQRALFTIGAAAAGETVLIHGASGAVGLLCCQLAKAAGLRVLATAGSEAGEQLVMSCGADAAFNHRGSDYTQQIAAAAGQSGIQLIIEMLANQNLVADCQLAGQGARIVIVGCRGSIDFNPRLIMMRELSIVGCALRAANQQQLRDYADKLQPQLADNSVRPVIANRFAIDQAAAAHEQVINKSASLGKVVLIIDPLNSD